MAQSTSTFFNGRNNADSELFRDGDNVIWSLSNPARYQPACAIDYLLRSVHLSGALPGYADLSSPFGVDISYGADTFVIYEAYHGSCEVSFEAGRTPLAFSQGDVLIVPRRMRHQFTNPSNTPCIDVLDLLREQVEPHVTDAEGRPSLMRLLKQRISHGGGGELFRLRMIVMFIDKQLPALLINCLPGPVLLSKFANQHRAFFNAIFDELDMQRSDHLIAQPITIRLTEALLTIVLKEVTSQKQSGSIYKGLVDPAIARVTAAILKNPKQKWKLEELQEIAHLSKSALNTRFSAFMGMTPRQFVTHIRLSRASELLTNTSLSIAKIAKCSNYGSEAAFNRAFSKWCGMTPGAVRINS
ncbi:AraC family transcriptional regulator [Pseudomonas fitomaticsae]|uniref:Helix-turn-helix domain-containing protein n=1 Tax=Pseudomonas fitomaticsae TaxID=2837969 RepID=A0ABY3PYB7_9PSED|nr:AraC family transcriptional regulator [Pseudomonas fitomaticsae]UFP98744.1 helix-turn-helix domain-containing protein [Pseudomonas fitomaticsae]